MVCAPELTWTLTQTSRLLPCGLNGQLDRCVCRLAIVDNMRKASMCKLLPRLCQLFTGRYHHQCRIITNKNNTCCCCRCYHYSVNWLFGWLVRKFTAKLCVLFRRNSTFGLRSNLYGLYAESSVRLKPFLQQGATQSLPVSVCLCAPYSSPYTNQEIIITLPVKRIVVSHYGDESTQRKK